MEPLPQLTEDQFARLGREEQIAYLWHAVLALREKIDSIVPPNGLASVTSSPPTERSS